MINAIKTGENLKALRKAKGLSVSDLAFELNLSEPSIYKWESGQSIPSVDRLVELSELYAVPIDTLIVRGEREE